MESVYRRVRCWAGFLLRISSTIYFQLTRNPLVYRFFITFFESDGHVCLDFPLQRTPGKRKIIIIVIIAVISTSEIFTRKHHGWNPTWSPRSLALWRALVSYVAHIVTKRSSLLQSAYRRLQLSCEHDPTLIPSKIVCPRKVDAVTYQVQYNRYSMTL